MGAGELFVVAIALAVIAGIGGLLWLVRMLSRKSPLLANMLMFVLLLVIGLVLAPFTGRQPFEGTLSSLLF